MEKVTISKRAAMACLDVLSTWLEDVWEIEDRETRSQILALDELTEALGQEWDSFKTERDTEREALQQQREEENHKPESLGRWLEFIWRNGDQDETAWKHLGHAFAALVHLGDWQLAKDYERPWMGTIPNMESALTHWWQAVATMLENDREGTLAEADRLAELAKTDWKTYSYASHLTAYLEDYEGAAA